MPTLKQDRTHQRLHSRDMLLLGIPFGLFFLLSAGGMLCWSWNGPLTVCGMSVAAAIGITAIVRNERRMRRFPCPACRTMLHRDIAREIRGSPITFLCKGCDIEWDTGYLNNSD